MEKTSQYYLELHEPEQRRRRNENKVDVDRYIRLVDALNIFKSKQYRPVILAMNVKQYDINDINRVLNKCLSIQIDRKSTRLNSSHVSISYAVFCLKKKKSVI